MQVRQLAVARRRKGLSLAITAILLTAILGIVGLCIDVGVLVAARAQLQTVADAAALAGAKQLNDPRRVSASYDVTADMTLADQQAIAIGTANTVLGQAAVVLSNPNNSSSGDVVVGYKDITVSNSSLIVSPTPQSLVNSVQVTARRDANHTSLVPAFFTKALGFPDNALAITSTATVQNYSVLGFNTSPSGYHTKLIPIALSLSTWNGMLQGLTTDNYTSNLPTSATVTNAPDGIYESSLYPVTSGAGNWGTVNIGSSSNGTSGLVTQISSGVTTNDLASMSSGGYFKLNPTVQMSGNPGVSLGIKSALQGLVGTTVMIPIYDPAQSGGNGANYQYTIVAFAPVVVLNTYFRGVHTGVTVQPGLVSDTNAIAGRPQPWTSGGVVRLHLSQ